MFISDIKTRLRVFKNTVLRLRVFKNTVLSYIHGPKKGKVKKAGENRILRGFMTFTPYQHYSENGQGMWYVGGTK